MADPNPYDSVVADISSGSLAAGARNSVMSVADRNPDSEAQLQTKASSLGVPYESARANQGVVNQRAAASAVDYDNLARTAPTTTRFLTSTSNAAIAHDDVGVLGSIENWFSSTGSYLSQKAASGLHSVAGVGTQLVNNVVGSAQELAAKPGQIAEDIGAIGSPAAEQKALVLKHLTAPTGSQTLQQFAVGQQQAATRIGARADQNTGFGDKSYFTLDPAKAAYLHPLKVLGDITQGLPQLAALAGSMYLTRGAAGSAGAEAGLAGLGTYMGTGQQLDTLASMPKEEIEKSPHYLALVKAGVPEASAEAYVRSQVAADQGKFSGVINTVLGAAGGSLQARLFGKVGDSLIARAATGAGTDALTWGGMGAGSQLGANVAEREDVNPEKNPFEGVGEAFLANAIQGGIFGGLTHVVMHGAAREAEVNDAAAQHEAINQFMDMAAASKLRERAPQTFHDLIGKMAEESPASNVYVDPHLLSEHLMQGKFEPDQKAAIEGMIAPKVEEAIRQGTDAEIPIEDYATLLAGTDAGKALQDHIKLDPNGMTKAEADEFMATKGEALKAEVDKTLAQSDEDTARKAEVDQVKQQVLDQLNQAGRFTPQANEKYADLHASFVDAMAKRTGVSPKEFIEQHPLKVVAPAKAAPVEPVKAAAPVEPAPLNTSADVSAKDHDVITYIRRLGGIKDTEGHDLSKGRGYSRRPGLINKRGRSIDEIGEALWERGYFGKEASRPTTAEVLDLVEKAFHEKTYAPHDTPSDNAHRESEDHAREQIRAFADQNEWHLDPADEDLALSYMADGADPESAAYQAFEFRTNHIAADVLDDIAREGVEGHDYEGAADRLRASAQGSAGGAKQGAGDENYVPGFDDARDSGVERRELGSEFYQTLNQLFEEPDQPQRSMTPEQRAELEARVQQSMARRGGQQSVKDQEGGLFSSARDQDSLFQGHRGSYSPDTNIITLLEHADLSTFLHESGHYFLETLSRLASSPDAPEDIRADFAKLTEWMGKDNWHDLTLDEKREGHEKFAEAFESYLFDGKAPSSKLKSLFRTFRSWLISVYRNATSLGAKPSPEIASVMDRMLASDEEIKQAQSQRAMEPLFSNQAQSGMEDARWQEYQSATQSSLEEAKDTLSARSLRDLKWFDNARGKELRRLQKSVETQRKATRAQVETEVSAEPVYKAQQFLKRGILDGEQTEGQHRLSISDVEDIGHTESKSALGYGKYGMLGEEGVHPDEVADKFGFGSGDELIRALTSAEPFKDRVSRLTEQRLLEEHGELTDPQSIEQAASEAVHNQFRAKAIAAELVALSKATGSPKLLAEAARQFAEETVAKTAIKDVRPAKYEAAAAKAGKAAEKALAKGDLNLAALEKRNQLFNTYAVKAARDALADVQKAVNHFNRIQRPGAQANMRGPFRAQLAALLDRFDLRASVPLKDAEEPLRPLNEWVQSEAERLSAVLPQLPDFVLNEGFKTHYRALSVEQMRGLADSVKQIEALARREQKQYMALKGMQFDEEKGKLLDQIRKSYPKAFHPDTGNPIPPKPEFVPGVGKSLAKAGNAFMGEFLSTEHLAAMLDGGKQGQAHASLFSRMNDRSDWKSKQLGEIAEEIRPLFDQWTLKEKRAYSRKGTYVPSIDTSLTRENMLVAALLAGSDDGRARLNNYGWDDAHIDDIVSHLDERDWKLADHIWKLFDEKLWPQLKDLNERTRGAAPPKVEAKPYPTKFGMARGGYFRLKYDTELDERAQRLDEGSQVKELLGGSTGMSAKTNQATSTERVDNVTMRPRLDLAVFNETVNETVHDLAYREAVADTIRVLNDGQVQNAIKGSLGTPEYRAFVRHVRDIAAPPRNPMGFIEKAISVARRNTIINMMSGVVTALVHVHGIVPAFTKIDTGVLASEIAKSFWLPSAIDRYKFASETSQFMAQRTSNLDRDVGKQIDSLTVKGRMLPGSAVFLALMTHIHKAIDSIVWNAAFREGLKIHENDQTAAVSHADHIVRQTQGSGRDVDLPSIMAGHGGWGELKKAFTMFSSYFNSQLQLLVQSGAVAKQEAREHPAQASAKFAAKFMLISIIPGLLYESLFGRDEPDANETGGGKILRYTHAIAEYNAGFVPLIGPAFDEAWSQFDHAEPDYGYKLSALQSAGEAVFQKGPHSIDKVVQGKDLDAQDAKNLIVAGGFLTGTPGKLAADVALGSDAVLTGRADASAIAFGPAHHKAGKRF